MRRNSDEDPEGEGGGGMRRLWWWHIYLKLFKILTWQKVWEQGVSVGATKGWRQIWHIKSSSTSWKDLFSFCYNFLSSDPCLSPKNVFFLSRPQFRITCSIFIPREGAKEKRFSHLRIVIDVRLVVRVVLSTGSTNPGSGRRRLRFGRTGRLHVFWGVGGRWSSADLGESWYWKNLGLRCISLFHLGYRDEQESSMIWVAGGLYLNPCTVLGSQVYFTGCHISQFRWSQEQKNPGLHNSRRLHNSNR